MGQVTIYLDQELEERMKTAAQAQGISVSRFVAELIRERTRTEWPQGVRELAGVWRDFPEAEELRAEDGVDLPREPL